MKSSILYFILIIVVLVGCTKESEPSFDQVINQNEININQLKKMATSSGWRVSTKVEAGDRTTPLTEGEIKNFQKDLHKYSVYPKMREEREVEVVPIGNSYLFMLPFASEFSTKAASSGSVMAYATYGYCFFNKCNRIPIKVCYDLDSNGRLIYAFGGVSSGIEDLDCQKLVYCNTAYYECSWSSDTVYLKLWLTQAVYRCWNGNLSDITFIDEKCLMSTGSVNIKTGAGGFDTREIGKDEWPPIITTGL